MRTHWRWVDHNYHRSDGQVVEFAPGPFGGWFCHGLGMLRKSVSAEAAMIVVDETIPLAQGGTPHDTR